MRPAYIALPFVLFAVCATPREQCVSDVTRDTKVLASLINEVRGNLARGYALDRQQEVRSVPKTCRAQDEDGDVFRFRCDETRTVTTVTPEAIDLNAERAKLSSLEERFVQSQAASNQAVAQCIAVHPE
ncbi:hypothetical protein [Roseobacter sp. CCS2]|uniref:hypothetical protein n=1 Tax=Roseobacter sp. CCS2 TaxID=391593 RepID=UPI0000F4017B|nr:hypothetical protein [Roseobacter sp. CCS2]EBA13189.1 hypothetical protein RCCS2_04869 [Roseobacter sp. CCS2]